MNSAVRNINHSFCSSYYPEAAVRLVIRKKKLFFLRKSKPLCGKCKVNAKADNKDKHILLNSGEDGGYDLSILPMGNYVITLYSHMPDTDLYSSYMRIPISIDANFIVFHNTPALASNIEELRKMATDEESLKNWLEATDYFSSDQEPIKEIAAKISEKCPEDNYLRVLAVHKFVARNLFYDYDELKATVRQDDSAIAVVKRRRTTCRGYVSLCVSLLRAMKIPAQEVPCYSAEPGQMIDIESVRPRTNHVVVAAFADNRWMLLDPTRDTHNRYRNGEFYRYNEQTSLAHFDMTEQLFSFRLWLPSSMLK